jgi:hypothetical protein
MHVSISALFFLSELQYLQSRKIAVAACLCFLMIGSIAPGDIKAYCRPLIFAQ